MARLVSREQIKSLHNAAMSLDRDSLLMGLPPGFIATIPRYPTPAAQLLADLHHLNVAEPLDDGTLPLEHWLENAILLAGPTGQAKVFESALAEARTRPQAPEPAAAAPRAIDININQQKALYTLLVELFSPDELLRFIQFGPDGRRLTPRLPGKTASFSEIATATVDLLLRERLVDDDFFRRLEEERPRRRPEIDEVKQLFPR